MYKSNLDKFSRLQTTNLNLVLDKLVFKWVRLDSRLDNRSFFIMPKFQYCGLNPSLIDIWKNIAESEKSGKEGSVYTINKFSRIRGTIGNLGPLIHTIKSEVEGTHHQVSWTVRMALRINGETHSQVNYISGQKLNLAFKISIKQHFRY